MLLALFIIFMVLTLTVTSIIGLIKTIYRIATSGTTIGTAATIVLCIVTCGIYALFDN